MRGRERERLDRDKAKETEMTCEYIVLRFNYCKLVDKRRHGYIILYYIL